MMNGRTLLGLPALSAALALSLSATATVAQPDKVGGAAQPDPIVLELITGDSWSDWSRDLFVSTVDELSDGQIQVRLMGAINELEVAARVQSGEADLGWVLARGLEPIGAKGFRALLAPFVVNDTATLKAIVTSPIGADMLAELDEHGLVGLSIDPGERRFVVGRGRPFVRLADFQGATIEVAPLASSEALIGALGARAVDVRGRNDAAMKAASVDGLVTSIDNTADPDRILTANLAIHAVPFVWFANAETMAQLSPEHRGVLLAAARAIQEAKLEATADTESTVATCVVGARIVTADAADVTEIMEAAQPVIDAMATDPVVAEYFARIADLKAGIEPAPFPRPCDAMAGSSDALTARIPDGTYTVALTPQDALRTGWPDPCATTGQSAVSTLVIEGTDWTQLSTCGDGPAEVGARGTFEYSGGTLVMREPGIPGQASYEWSADETSLTLKVIETVDEYAPLAVLQYLFEHEYTRSDP